MWISSWADWMTSVSSVMGCFFGVPETLWSRTSQRLPPSDLGRSSSSVRLRRDYASCHLSSWELLLREAVWIAPIITAVWIGRHGGVMQSGENRGWLTSGPASCAERRGEKTERRMTRVVWLVAARNMGLFHGKCKSWSWSLIMTSPVRHSQDPAGGGLAGGVHTCAGAQWPTWPRPRSLPASFTLWPRRPEHWVSPWDSPS